MSGLPATGVSGDGWILWPEGDLYAWVPFGTPVSGYPVVIHGTDPDPSSLPPGQGGDAYFDPQGDLWIWQPAFESPSSFIIRGQVQYPTNLPVPGQGGDGWLDWTGNLWSWVPS